MERNISISVQPVSQSLDTFIKDVNNTAFYFNSLLLSIGILGNVASFLVFTHQTLRKRKFNWYLLTLTFFEFLFCLIGFIDYIYIKINKKGIFLHDTHQISFMVVDYGIHTSDLCTVILTLLLSIDRLYAIKNPMKIKEFITNLHAKKALAISLLIAVLLKTTSYTFCELNIEKKTIIFYCSIISPMLFHAIPSVIILIVNAMLAKQMCSFNSDNQLDENDANQMELLNVNLSQRSNTINRTINTIAIRSTYQMRKFSCRGKSKTQKSHYIIIFVLSLWFAFTSIPYYIFNTYFSLLNLKFFSATFQLKSVLRIQMISSVLFNLNHCVHFFVYFSFYSEFRNILKVTFLKFLQNNE